MPLTKTEDFFGRKKMSVALGVYGGGHPNGDVWLAVGHVGVELKRKV